VIERVVLRPLVNQPDIILFMATIGITLFLIGFGEIIFGGENKVMITERWASRPARSTFEPFGGFVSIEQKDVTAVVGAVLLVAVLLLFLNKSKMGRAIRALGDDHQAALSVGISLSTIWVLVWFIAGVIALATGIVWGARAGVSFALEVIAYKALPVLMLGGLEIGPRRHHRRAGDRHPREAVRNLLGPAAARRQHRDLVRLRLRAHRAPVPAAGPVRRTHHRAGVRDRLNALPHRRPVQDILRRRPCAVPGQAGCVAAGGHSRLRLRDHPATASDFAINALLIPVLIYALAALGLNILTGYAGQLSLGTGAFMGVGAYACYKLTTIFPDLNLIAAIALSGFFSAVVGVAFGLPSLRIKGFYLAIATLAAQFFLVWLFEKWAWLYNYNTSGAIQVANIDMFGITVAGPERAAAHPVFLRARRGDGGDVARHQHHARSHRPHLEVGARHGHRGRARRHQPDEGQALGLRRVVIHRRHRGRAVRLPVARRGGAHLFDIPLSFRVLFIAIIGGLGSMLGNFLGAILIVALPVVLGTLPAALGLPIASATAEHLNVMIVGALIILFLIVEPHGLARFWAIIGRNSSCGRSLIEGCDRGN
jgi:branched-chain amino acid transport system permease protein